jgi:hypothetical protein
MMLIEVRTATALVMVPISRDTVSSYDSSSTTNCKTVAAKARRRSFAVHLEYVETYAPSNKIHVIMASDINHSGFL